MTKYGISDLSYIQRFTNEYKYKNYTISHAGVRVSIRYCFKKPKN